MEQLIGILVLKHVAKQKNIFVVVQPLDQKKKNIRQSEYIKIVLDTIAGKPCILVKAISAHCTQKLMNSNNN